MRTMDVEETRNALQAHGLDHPAGIGFAVRDPALNAVYDWHTHAYHQLIYAIAGPSQIETSTGRHVLPQGRAAWIPAHTRHRSLITGSDGASLFFSSDVVIDTSRRVRILAASPLMREMILFAMRWPLGASDGDCVAESFFRTLALLCGEWLDRELPLFLPSAVHPGIQRAMDYATADLHAATQAGAFAAAALSERTFRRRFQQEASMGWQEWLAQARILMAMGLLIEGRRVTDVAAEVGYASLSAFAKSFAQLTGETPTRFKQRHGPVPKPGIPQVERPTSMRETVTFSSATK